MQPLFSFLQHQSFFGPDQAWKSSKPATQSYGFVMAQPRWWILQHHDFFPSDQPASQLAQPRAQLYGSAGGGGAVGCGGAVGGAGGAVGGAGGAGVVETGFGQPRPPCLQHQSFFGPDHPDSQFANPASQSYGALVVCALVVVQPRFSLVQQYCFLLNDHPTSHVENPASQSNGFGFGCTIVVEVTGVGHSSAAPSNSRATTPMPPPMKRQV